MAGILIFGLAFTALDWWMGPAVTAALTKDDEERWWRYRRSGADGGNEKIPAQDHAFRAYSNSNEKFLYYLTNFSLLTSLAS